MGDLVDELLLLARLDAESGSSAAEPVRDEVDLSSLLAEAARDAQAAGLDHRWGLEVDDEPVVVLGDPEQLRRVVVNLLANARIHTPAGTRILASVHRDPDPASPAGVVIVENDGPAIPEEVLPTLFERFTRGDSSRARATGTTGLGLAIVRAVVDAHGGSVSATSAPGSTRFVVRLPLAGL
jgi:two-component system OmpR family sensor kinase